MSTTIEQQRASFALNCIERMQGSDPGHYVSYVSAMPAQIINNGLGQTLATLLASAGRQSNSNHDPHYLLCEHVAKWLHREIPSFSQTPEDSRTPKLLIESLMKCDQQIYFEAQIEALAFLDWLKKFARALLEETSLRNSSDS